MVDQGKATSETRRGPMQESNKSDEGGKAERSPETAVVIIKQRSQI
ncbi:LOW QUALITY PROTEIN: hypothetical protein TorRG33x02_130290 [Trema orientale]|uniref:Uncharacterized protein n=1 Tax=Trema orientale TaxID=63057 RepID=A0A2P5F0A4_TREOI|nr:LOW QUALITY PROTEIN: hypothetical protein TorRG33x02_130290 [Trema orientale]